MLCFGRDGTRAPSGQAAAQALQAGALRRTRPHGTLFKGTHLLDALGQGTPSPRGARWGLLLGHKVALVEAYRDAVHLDEILKRGRFSLPAAISALEAGGGLLMRCGECLEGAGGLALVTPKGEASVNCTPCSHPPRRFSTTNWKPLVAG